MPKVCKLIKVLLHVGDLRPSGLMYWALSLFQSEGPEFIELPSISPSHWISASRTVPIKRAGISLVAVYQVPHSLGSKHLIPGLRSHNSLSPTVPCFTDPYMFIHNVPSWVYQFKLLTGNNAFWPDIPSSSRAWKLQSLFPRLVYSPYKWV